MIYKLEHLQEIELCAKAFINNKWVPARPINYKFRTLKQKIKECYYLWIGKTDSFLWPEGQ